VNRVRSLVTTFIAAVVLGAQIAVGIPGSRG
jgi:hypothetical protein